MNKETFLKELAYLLQDISDEDREDALIYYENYFDEAGEINEFKVLSELQSPERVAALIKSGYNENFEETIEYSESSMGDSRYNRQHEIIIPEIVEDTNTDREYKKSTKDATFKGNNYRNGLLIGTIITVAIFGLPFLGVGIILFFTLVILLLSLGITIGGFGIASLAIAITVFVRSLMRITIYPSASLVGIGTSLLFLALGIVLFKNIKWSIIAVPRVIQKGLNLFRNLIDRIGGR